VINVVTRGGCYNLVYRSKQLLNAILSRMKIFLIRHGKSDKSLQGKLPHNEFEFLRPLVEGEIEKAKELGNLIRSQIESLHGYDFVWSGKMRSMQTVTAIAEGLGVSSATIQTNLREDFGLTYLADKNYWEGAEQSIKNGSCLSHAEFFLNNPPTKYFTEKGIDRFDQTFSAEYMQQNMRAVFRRAIERNTFLKNEVVIMVSHEPVISLYLSDLTGKTTFELGGSCKELEYAVFNISLDIHFEKIVGEVHYRGEKYHL
jgi:broad specificity phosphatase PhoE